jgi:DNA-binding LacI/PurR family transcriptional regulator|tara:strand:- start:118 stop:444 length:327 start_codon:yes stop_codon:yes gene_type:complete
MATIKYEILSKSENAPIYLRLSIKRELNIPEDISIVGFDDMYWSNSLNPPLTAVRQSGYDVGKRAAELLLQRIQNSTRSNISVIIKTKLMIRKSCKNINVVKNISIAI